MRPDDDPSWHEPMAREAEQNGSDFAAAWHLDRLIAARPGDWFLRTPRPGPTGARPFRPGRGRLPERRAAQLTRPGPRLPGALRDRLQEEERWAEALWYLDRLITARPDDWSLRADRAAVYGKLGREADRQAELARVFAMGADAGVVLPRAEELGRAGRWPEAAARLPGAAGLTRWTTCWPRPGPSPA